MFRKWTAISLIAAALEQKVWLPTARPLYPNLYIFIVGHPGVGKSRTMGEGRRLIKNLQDFHLAPISMTFASLVDTLKAAKKSVISPPFDPLEYNSLYICADEIGAFVHKYDNEMIDGLSAFYDPAPYQQVRRTSDLKIKIESPQINMICGTTPQNLLDLMPEKAWGQGFTSRTIMVFSDERIIGDDFAESEERDFSDLLHDLNMIAELVGPMQVSTEYREVVNNWIRNGEQPVPNHPKLIHYVTRRKAHLYKLSMISSIEKSNGLIITKNDFDCALHWLLEAELRMFEIFQAGATGADGAAMEEIMHFVRINDKGHGVSERAITRFASTKIPIHSVLRVIDILERGGQIHVHGVDLKTQLRWFKVAA